MVRGEIPRHSGQAEDMKQGRGAATFFWQASSRHSSRGSPALPGGEPREFLLGNIVSKAAAPPRSSRQKHLVFLGQNGRFQYYLSLLFPDVHRRQVGHNALPWHKRQQR